MMNLELVSRCPSSNDVEWLLLEVLIQYHSMLLSADSNFFMTFEALPRNYSNPYFKKSEESWIVRHWEVFFVPLGLIIVVSSLFFIVRYMNRKSSKVLETSNNWFGSTLEGTR